MPAARLNELNGTVAGLAGSLERFVALGADVEKDNRPLKYFKDGRVLGAITEELHFDFGEVVTEIFHRTDAVRNSTALIGFYGQDLKSEERYEQSVGDISRRAGRLADELDALLTEARIQAAALTELKTNADGEHGDLEEAWGLKSQTFDVMAQGAEAAKGKLETTRDRN